MNARNPILEVQDLVTTFDTDGGRLTAVDGVSFGVQRGRTLGIVGESGCGKSVTALSIMRLLPQPMGRIAGGKILFDGKDLVTLPPDDMHRIRGGRIGMIFQEPMTALNPVHTIGRQLSEVFLLHRTKDKAEAWRRGTDMLRKVGIPAPEVRMGEYPQQLSGGQLQRVAIARALVHRPSLLLADEPTGNLDPSTAVKVMDALIAQTQEQGTSLVLVTHSEAAAARADRVLKLFANGLV